jgi:uncharacterized damage-inducible protein DinB
MVTDLFHYQYDLVKSSREEVFRFCGTLKQSDYTKGVTFDGKSIRRLQVHLANTYQGWIIKVARGRNTNDFDEQNYPTVQSVQKLFTAVDTIVSYFIRDSRHNWMEEVGIDTGDQVHTLTKAQIFTHVITHEFHHKGQILMLARGMGYTPPDTDIIRDR